MADPKFREIKRRYTSTDLSTYIEACNRIGHEIATIKTRSYRERNELAKDAVDALYEVGRRLQGAAVPGSPELPASRGDPVSSAFGLWYDGIKRRERQRVVWRAANWILRDKADGWLRPRTIRDHESPDRLVLAVESDEGLAAVLKELDAFPKPAR